MKSVISMALVLLLSATAAGVHAQGSKFSLFRCGVQLGGNPTVHKAFVGSHEKQSYGSNQVVKPLASIPTGTIILSGDTTSQTGRRQISRTVTLANLGCSWR